MSSSYISAALRKRIVERAQNRCEYCRIAQADKLFTFEVDHIIAEKHGGQTIEQNLCLACVDCNSAKGSDIASVDWEQDEAIVGLYHPRRQNWHDHFTVELETGRIVPNSSYGRVTIFLLQLNIDERVMDRQLLIADGRYEA